MGVYTIYIGKGIIIPTKLFIKKYLGIMNDMHNDKNNDMHTITETIIKKYVGETFDFSFLGHDAFQSRNDDMGILYNTDNEKSFELIKQWIEEAKCIDISLTKVEFYSDLMFIGVFDDACTDYGEFGYYVKAPEIIYGLPALIPGIIRCYNKYSKTDCNKLVEIFGQNPCIWTFTNDCVCCG